MDSGENFIGNVPSVPGFLSPGHSVPVLYRELHLCTFRMSALASNPYFQIAVGAVLSLVGSFWANYWFHGRVEKKRAEREAKRAYNNLMNRLVHTTISDINHPLHLLPVEISDRVEDLKFALQDVNSKFDYLELVNKAILQAVDLRKQQEKKHGHEKS